MGKKKKKVGRSRPSGGAIDVKLVVQVRVMAWVMIGAATPIIT